MRILAINVKNHPYLVFFPVLPTSCALIFVLGRFVGNPSLPDFLIAVITSIALGWQIFAARQEWLDIRLAGQLGEALTRHLGNFEMLGQATFRGTSEVPVKRTVMFYCVTFEDIEEVLATNVISAEYASLGTFDHLVEYAYMLLDDELIENAALSGESSELQAEYANQEVVRQLRKHGLIAPIRPPLAITAAAKEN